MPIRTACLDGMTVDADGYVWSARVLTGEMHRYSPSGELVESIDFPCDMVSSAVFGGGRPLMSYTSRPSAQVTARTHGPGAGALFRIRPGVKGVPEFFSNVSF